MGYAMCFGNCYCCHKPFTFNPLRVPSVRDPSTGHKEPICQDCIVVINEKRIAKGLEPAVIHDDAYTGCPEEELPYE